MTQRSTGFDAAIAELVRRKAEADHAAREAEIREALTVKVRAAIAANIIDGSWEVSETDLDRAATAAVDALAEFYRDGH